VVCETETSTLDRSLTSAETRLLLPAPEGAEMMYKLPFATALLPYLSTEV